MNPCLPVCPPAWTGRPPRRRLCPSFRPSPPPPPPCAKTANLNFLQWSSEGAAAAAATAAEEEEGAIECSTAAGESRVGPRPHFEALDSFRCAPGLGLATQLPNKVA